MRPASREALGRRALPRSQGEHALATRFGVDFSTGDAASGRKARGGVLELTLGCGSRAQSQRAGGNRGKRKSRRLGEQAPSVEAIDRQTRGCRLCRVRIFGAKIFERRALIVGKTVS